MELEYVDYMTAQQAADKWGVSLRWVQTYLKNDRIEGAIRFGHAYMIPKNAKKPTDPRKKSKIERKKNDENHFDN